MARNDIQPFSATDGSHEVVVFPLAASQSVAQGEPVAVTAGELSEATDDPPAIKGIAVAPTFFGTLNGNTTVRPTGTLIQCYSTARRQTFYSKNFATDGAGTAATPTVANATGRLAGLTLTGGGSWVVDTGCDNLIVEILEVRTANGSILGEPKTAGLTGTTVVFRFL